MTIYPLAGIGLPIVGPHAGPAAIREIALVAAWLGFRSMSLSEWTPLPGDLLSGDSRSNYGGLKQRPGYDAIESLTWVARQTDRVPLHTDTLVRPDEPDGEALVTTDALTHRRSTLENEDGGGNFDVATDAGNLG